MSHSHDPHDGEHEKKKTDWGEYASAAYVVGLLVLVFGGVATDELWPYLHGATPAQLESEPLGRTPSEVAKDLPSTTLGRKSVSVRFRVGAARPYKSAQLRWNASERDGVTDLDLTADRHAENGDDVRAALGRHLHGMSGSSWEWGPVSIAAHGEHGDVGFRIERTLRDRKPNPLFDRQVEAARQLVLNAAFGLPISLSDREIADALGTGYPPAALVKLAPDTPIERAGAEIRALFPAAVSDTSTSFEVPLDHPLVRSVSLDWSNAPGGALDSVHLSSRKAYAANRATLQACLAKQLGPPKVTTTDYAAGKTRFTFVLSPALTLVLGTSSLDVSLARAAVDPKAGRPSSPRSTPAGRRASRARRRADRFRRV